MTGYGPAGTTRSSPRGTAWPFSPWANAGGCSAARDAATLLAEVHLAGGRLIRTSRHGSAGDTPGILEDYACVAEGFTVLSGLTGEGRWAALAGQLLDVALTEFGDGAGGFYETAAAGEARLFPPA